MTELQDALASYRRRCETFRWDVPPYFNFGRDIVDRHACEAGRPALLWRDAAGRSGSLDFAQVAATSNRVAHLFRDLGLAPGDPVIVMLPRVPEWHCTMVGLLKAGALVIPSSTLLRPKDIAFRARHSGARALIAHREQRPAVEAARAELPAVRHLISLDEDGAAPPAPWLDLHTALASQPEDDSAIVDTAAQEPALVYYTSGTTGPPKAVLHDHAYTYAQRYTALNWLGVRGDDRLWTTSDTGWAKAAYGVLFGPWSVGAEIFLYNGRFEARRELELLAEVAPQVFCAPPTEYRMLAQEDLSAFSFPSLREAVSAGEPLNPEVIRAWRLATGLEIRDGYGQTETILLVGNGPGQPLKPGSMGLPTPGHRVEVIDGDGEILPQGEIGDVALHGDPPSLFRGYWKNPEASAGCRRGPWYVTGDRAWRDEDGYFWFVGRADDVIISAGYRIGPFEVESALIEHPDVVEAAVVGAPDAKRGSIVKAYVVLREGAVSSPELAGQLQEHVKSVTAPYKYPRAVEFCAELPKTVSGKIRRVELREASQRGDKTP